MEQPEIEKRIQEFIAREMLTGQGNDLDRATPLLEWGILDSLNMLTLTSFLENSFSIRVPAEETRPENFSTVASLAEMVTRLSGAGGSGPSAQ